MYEEEYDYDAYRQYEDDMYHSDNTDASGEKVDSDIEDTLLSHVYYTPKSQKSTPAQGNPSSEKRFPDSTPSKIGNPFSNTSPEEETASDSSQESSDSDQESDTKYSLSKKSKKQEVSSENDSSEDSDSSVEWDESREEERKEIVPKAETSIEPPPTEESDGATALNKTSIQHTEPLMITQVITPNKNVIPEYQPDSSKVSEDEYEYLEDADIKGKNRYFMEPDSGKKGQACYICKEHGHLARDCTVLKCFICGEEGHTSRDCLFTSEICHNCNKRGHRARECPLIWRQYVTANPNAPKSCLELLSDMNGSDPQIKSDRMFCYNCGDCGHFGDQCKKTKMDQNSSVDSSAFGSAKSNYRNSRSRADEDRRPAKRYRTDFHDDYRPRYEDRDYNRGYSREKSYRRDRQYDHDNS
ncbi:hypothetical protein K493DRAFT_296044 [Basidiobolus meristosporus CBS 931.73]|uniref:CCHC-type domain-containing protein n=1 Tax=Basidiobolus meristosporus CBS 931.73 TaxID=1314790 RepID=A0A1Y1Z8G4_9FUNG|nr:hypothetical protein K493DRAFT_296044 [Basidiobolus meristosporus CBS 931.73]|eukprot:ORY06297.1 hypothetical protein K493DRAFT_296044 [Basidiobolus meristosporus CBS 931.73]